MDLPPIPRLNLPDLFKLRMQIVDEVAFPYYHDAMEGDTLAAFARDLANHLAGRGADKAAVRQTCNLLLGQELTMPCLGQFAARVAGNLDVLKTGKPLGPYKGVHELTWWPMTVAAAMPARDHYGELGCEYTLRAMTGPLCPGTLVKFWKQKVLYMLARELGFSQYRDGPMPFRHAMQLVGLWFFALIDPLRTREGKPGFQKIGVASSMRTHNQEVLKRRYRVGDHLCPFGCNGADFLECHRCAMGYRGKDGEDACRAACHVQGYQEGPCSGCGEAEAMFDPEVSLKSCVACVMKKRTERKE